MKALPMLDHVMLLVARAFTATLLAVACLPFFLMAFTLIIALFTVLAFPDVGTVTFYTLHLSLQELIRRPFPLLELAYAFLWFFTVRHLYSLIARICLGLSSGTYLVIVAMSLFFIPSHLGFILLFIWGGLVGLTSMVWVSVRPPQSLKTSTPNLFSAHPSPNPVNLVNPV